MNIFNTLFLSFFMFTALTAQELTFQMISPCGNDGDNEFIVFTSGPNPVTVQDIGLGSVEDEFDTQWNYFWSTDDTGVSGVGITETSNAVATTVSGVGNYDILDITVAADQVVYDAQIAALNAIAGAGTFVSPDPTTGVIPSNSNVIFFLGAGDLSDGTTPADVLAANASSGGDGFDDIATNLDFSSQTGPFVAIFGNGTSNGGYFSNSASRTQFLTVGSANLSVSYTPSGGAAGYLDPTGTYISDGACIPATSLVAAPACDVPVYTAITACTADANINGITTGEAAINTYYIEVAVTNSGGNDVEVTDGTITETITQAQIAAGELIVLGPYTFVDGLVTQTITVQNVGAACNDVVEIREAICGFTPDNGDVADSDLHSFGYFCMDQSPISASATAPAILAQMSPTAQSSGGSTATSVVYVLTADTDTGDADLEVVAINNSGLFEGLVNGVAYTMNVFTVLTSDRAALEALFTVGQNYSAPSSSSICFSSCGSTTITPNCFTCPIIDNPSSDQSICFEGTPTDITAEIDQNIIDVEFVYFSTAQTGINMYTGGTAIGSAQTPSGATDPFTVTAAAANLPTALGTYFIYAILDTDDADLTDPTCRPFVEIEYVVNALPVPMIAQPAELTCTTTTVNLDASSSTGQATLIFAWTTVDGTIDSNEDTATPTVSAPGTYTLTLTDGNTCVATSSVVVSQDITPPTAAIAAATELTCSTTSIILNASSSTGQGTLSYNWTTADGNIVSDGTTAMPTVDAAGTYQVEITDADNGCTDTEVVVVAQDITAPTAAIAAATELTCSTTSIILNASSSTGQGTLSYNWTTGDGNIVSDGTTAMPTVDAAGTYQVEITDSDNGCTDIEVVVVAENTTAPVINPIDPAAVCSGMTVDVSAIALNEDIIGGTTTYHANAANATSGTDPLSGAEITAVSATMTIHVRYELATGCFTTDAINVTVNPNPTASISIDNSVVCSTNTNATLTISGTAGAEVIYNSGTTDLTITIEADGSNDIAISPTESTIYTLISVTNTTTTCSTNLTDNVSITVNQVNCNSFPWDGN